MSDSYEIDWGVEPSEWPYTPPLSVYRDLIIPDPDLFWRMDSGHVQNVLEDALDQLGDSERDTVYWMGRALEAERMVSVLSTRLMSVSTNYV